MLPGYLLEGLTGTQHMNPGLWVHARGEASFTNSGGERRYVRKTEQRYKLYFRLWGCRSGLQHYRICTPQSISKESDLWCPFCMYCKCGWAAADKALIPENELVFIRLLLMHGCSEHWCHQVRHYMWHGAFDFWNWRDNVFVQVDGVCHWQGMHTSLQSRVAERDFACNLTAVQAGVGLVRVHETDLQEPVAVMAAIATAAAERCVVFTSTYRLKACMQYTWLLQAVQLYCLVRYDAFGNTICKPTAAYLVRVSLALVFIKAVPEPAVVCCAGGELKVDEAVGADERRV